VEEGQENISQEISDIPVRQLRRLSRNMTLWGMLRSRGSSFADSSLNRVKLLHGGKAGRDVSATAAGLQE
jgi:hypothetical protein